MTSVKAITKEQETILPCQECGKRYKYKGALLRHTKTRHEAKTIGNEELIRELIMELIETVEGKDKNDNADNVIEKDDMEEENDRSKIIVLRKKVEVDDDKIARIIALRSELTEKDKTITALKNKLK